MTKEFWEIVLRLMPMGLQKSLGFKNRFAASSVSLFDLTLLRTVSSSTRSQKAFALRPLAIVPLRSQRR